MLTGSQSRKSQMEKRRKKRRGANQMNALTQETSQQRQKAPKVMIRIVAYSALAVGYRWLNAVAKLPWLNAVDNIPKVPYKKLSYLTAIDKKQERLHALSKHRIQSNYRVRFFTVPIVER